MRVVLGQRGPRCSTSHGSEPKSSEMATCPRCHGTLEHGHTCRGVPAQTARAILAVVTAAAVGLITGGFTFGLLADATHMRELEIVGFVAGPIVAVILARALRAF